MAWVEEHYPHARGYVHGDHADDAQEVQAQNIADGDEKVTLIEFWYRRYDAKTRRNRVHMAQAAGGALRGPNTIHLLTAGDLRVAHLGDLGCALNEEEKARLRDLDVLMVPVGGFYTIGPEEAWDLVRDLRPRVTVPMHYRLGRVGLPAVQELGAFLALADGVVRHPTDTIVVDAQTPRQVAVPIFGK